MTDSKRRRERERERGRGREGKGQGEEETNEERVCITQNGLKVKFVTYLNKHNLYNNAVQRKLNCQ